MNQALLQLKFQLDHKQTNTNFVDILYKISEAEYFSESTNELYTNLFNILNEFIPTRNFYIALSKGDKIEIPFEHTDAENKSKENFETLKFGKTLFQGYDIS